MASEDKLIDVARYMEGDMEGEELQQFQALLNHDRVLQEQVATYKEVHQSLKMRIAPSVDDQQVEARLKELNSQYFQKRTPVIGLYTYLKWAGVAAVLIIGLFVWAPWSSGLYEKYTISREMSVTERGNTQKNELAEAAALYNSKDFVAASKVLEKQYLVNPDRPLVAYYYALTLVECQQEDKARTIFLKLYAGESVFKYDALYNVGLSYVKQHQDEQALNWLNKIPKENRNYEQAQELIRKLK